jgi:hypothetical protein
LPQESPSSDTPSARHTGSRVHRPPPSVRADFSTSHRRPCVPTIISCFPLSRAVGEPGRGASTASGAVCPSHRGQSLPIRTPCQWSDPVVPEFLLLVEHRQARHAARAEHARPHRGHDLVAWATKARPSWAWPSPALCAMGRLEPI